MVANAQSPIGFRSGLEAGYEYSSLSYDDELSIWDPGWDHGFSAGVFLIMDIAAPIGIRSGLRFVRYRNHVDIPRVSNSLFTLEGEFEVTQEYLALPVLLEWRPLPVPGLFMVAGPEFGWLLAAEVHSAITEESSFLGTLSLEETEDIERLMDSGNVSIVIGAGLAAPLGGFEASVQVRYNHGLAGTADEDQWISDWKTRAVELILGIEF